MLTLSFCHPCTKTLYEYGSPAINIFEEICRQYVKDNQALMIADEFSVEYLNLNSLSEFFTILNFLETKGYVTTTEVEQNRILVRPNGIVCEENFMLKNGTDEQVETYCHFCLKGHVH